jgi:hypothetical protein
MRQQAKRNGDSPAERTAVAQEYRAAIERRVSGGQFCLLIGRL